MANLLPPLANNVPIVDLETGNPTPVLQRLLQKLSLATGLSNSNGVIGLANIAYQTILGRNSAGSGAAENVTLSQILDWIGSAARGDVFFRGATTWSRLPAGTAGQVLTTQGTTADPTWTTPATGGGGGGTTPTIRSTAIQAGSGVSSMAVTLPAGTVAGDIVIVGMGTGYNVSSGPTGWTVFASSNQSFYNGMIAAKVMVAADITLGTATFTFTGAFDSHAISICLTGATVVSVVQPVAFLANTAGGAVQNLSPAGVKTSNLVIGFLGNRASSTNTVTFNGVAGTVQQTASTANSSAGLVTGVATVSQLGGVACIGSMTTGGSGVYFGVVAVG